MYLPCADGSTALALLCAAVAAVTATRFQHAVEPAPHFVPGTSGSHHLPQRRARLPRTAGGIRGHTAAAGRWHSRERVAGTARHIALGTGTAQPQSAPDGLACACAGTVGELRAAGSERGHWADTGVRAAWTFPRAESEPLAAGGRGTAPVQAVPPPASFAGRYQCSQGNFAGAYCLPGYRAGAIYIALSLSRKRKA